MDVRSEEIALKAVMAQRLAPTGRIQLLDSAFLASLNLTLTADALQIINRHWLDQTTLVNGPRNGRTVDHSLRLSAPCGMWANSLPSQHRADPHSMFLRR